MKTYLIKRYNYWSIDSLFIHKIKQPTWMTSVSKVEVMPRNFAISARSAKKCSVSFELQVAAAVI